MGISKDITEYMFLHVRGKDRADSPESKSKHLRRLTSRTKSDSLVATQIFLNRGVDKFYGYMHDLLRLGLRGL